MSAFNLLIIFGFLFALFSYALQFFFNISYSLMSPFPKNLAEILKISRQGNAHLTPRFPQLSDFKNLFGFLAGDINISVTHLLIESLIFYFYASIFMFASVCFLVFMFVYIAASIFLLLSP